MKYTRFRQYLARENRDMRNPYGSRGGYVVSDRGRDYEYDRMGDYARGREYDRMGYDRNYNSTDYARNGDYNQYDREYNRDGSRRYGYFDYETDGMRDYRDYNYDMARGRRDYAEEDYKLDKHEIEEWEKAIKGGNKYTVDQVRQIAQQHGIQFNQYSPELLTAVTNAVCSDYGEVVRGDIAMYVKMAKAFLEDKDFDGTPEEKAYLYYKAIVDKE